MRLHSEEEFLSDMRAAVSWKSSEARRNEAIEWQIGRSANHDQKILWWLVQLKVSDYLNKPRCQPLVRAVFNSPTSNFEELLGFYIKAHQSFKSAEVREQVRDVLFSSRSLFLSQFKKLDENTKQRLLAELFSIDPYQSRFSLEICCLAECCDWGVLHRLVPHRESWIGENEVHVVATQWFRVWQTYCDINDTNEKGAS